MSSFFNRKVAVAVAVVVLSIGVASTQAVAAQDKNGTEAPFNVTCKRFAEDSLGLDPWPAVTPAENTMEACRAFISDPKNLNKGKFGPFQVLGNAGTWDINSTIFQDALGHEFCIDDEDDPCIEEGSCPGNPLEWVGACTWKP